jgi:glucosamine--fructose-6-phosphate aminotransferase (isomerizing)
MHQFEREIREQPACLMRLLRAQRGAVEQIAHAVRRFAPRFVVTAARGSSDNAARYAKYLWGAHNHLVVSLGAPSLITQYHAAPALGQALVIGISQSGESPDIVALLSEGGRQGALTVAVTNQPQSPLARAATHVIELQVGPEQAVVASKSYTAQLLALAMLSAAVEDNPARWRELEGLPEAAEMTLASNSIPRMSGALATLAPSANRMLVVGRGFNFATTFEVALKIKETAYVMADPYAAPDLFHGPLAMVEPGFPAMVIAPSGATMIDMASAIDVLADRGADLVTISDDQTLLARPGVRLGLPLPPNVPEWLSPITAVIPGQLWALALAEARGLDPDSPRGLSKVTKTR